MRKGIDAYYEIPFEEGEWVAFKEHLFYVPGSFTEMGDFKRLANELEKGKGDPDNRLYYLAAPPRFFADIVENLDEVGMVDETEGFRRVVIEKPFGDDLQSAQELNQKILTCACILDRKSDQKQNLASFPTDKLDNSKNCPEKSQK